MQNLIRFVMPAALLVAALGWAGNDSNPAEPAPAGTITGTVRFTGKLQPPQKIATTDGTVLEHNDLVVDGKTKGLRYVVAFLEDAPAQAKVEKQQPVLVDQRDLVFVPRVVAVQHGQAVRFENNDLCNHSVMASSTVKANQFNQVAGPSQPVEHTFELQKRPVLIGCSLHNWMRAWIYVLPHPWFAVTDEKGAFRIAAVPPGKYTLLLTHPDTNHQERREVTVVAGKTADVAVDWEKVDRK
jgi:plastocyanin